MNMPLAPELQLALLELLADGESRSPADLARMAGMDEAILRASLSVLADHGVRRARDGRWRLVTPFEPLDAATIAAAPEFAGSDVSLEVRGVTGSTNDDARERLLASGDPRLGAFAIFAEAQSKGRGRRGRDWSSPVASNIYMTQVEALAGGPDAATGLSLAIGVAVAEALDRLYGLDVQLKWPNDLLVRGRKLGGILVELAPSGPTLHALVGIGLNVRVPDYVGRAIDQPWIDLTRLVDAPVSRNRLASALVASVHGTLAQFRAEGFSARLRARWQARDPFFDRRVAVTGVDLRIDGVARGIDERGELLIDTPSGRERLGAGEVSIRLREET